MRKLQATAPLPLKSAALPAFVTVTKEMGARQSLCIWLADNRVAVTLLKLAPFPLNDAALTFPCTSREAAALDAPMLTFPLNLTAPRNVWLPSSLATLLESCESG